MVSSEPAARGAAVENSGRPVNSCAVSVWETEWILAFEAVDMLRTDVRIDRHGSPRPLPVPDRHDMKKNPFR